MLRGEYGIKQNKNLNERLKPDIIKLHKELQARPKIVDDSHGYFVKASELKKKRDSVGQSEDSGGEANMD